MNLEPAALLHCSWKKLELLAQVEVYMICLVKFQTVIHEYGVF